MNGPIAQWLHAINDWLAWTVASIFITLPSILAAAAVLIFGWLVARLARGLVRRQSLGVN